MEDQFKPKNFNTIALKKSSILEGVFKPVIVQNSGQYGHTSEFWAKYLKLDMLYVAVDNNYTKKETASKSMFGDVQYIKTTTIECEARKVNANYFRIDNVKKFYIFCKDYGFEFQLKEIVNGVHIYVMINEINHDKVKFIMADGCSVNEKDYKITAASKRKPKEVAYVL